MTQTKWPPENPGGFTNDAGDLIGRTVADELTVTGHLSAAAQISTWLNDPAAPKEIKNDLAQYLADNGVPYVFPEIYLEKWVEELVCDLFGLLLFGPGFVAAHQVLLRPTHRTPYEFDLLEPTHPPYAVRHKMLVRALRLLNWDKPVTRADQGNVHQAELTALNFILDDPYIAWASFFENAQLSGALQGLRNVLRLYGNFEYRHPDPKNLADLIERLTRRLPPIGADIDENGTPTFSEMSPVHSLFAGWVYWLGKDHLVGTNALSFLETNKLCDQALLQDRGILVGKAE